MINFFLCVGKKLFSFFLHCALRIKKLILSRSRVAFPTNDPCHEKAWGFLIGKTTCPDLFFLWFFVFFFLYFPHKTVLFFSLSVYKHQRGDGCETFPIKPDFVSSFFLGLIAKYFKTVKN